MTVCSITVMPFGNVNILNAGVNFNVMGRPIIKPALICYKYFNEVISTESETRLNALHARSWFNCE